MSENLKQKEAAERFGLTTRQIHNLVDEGLPTTLIAGKRVYPWPECLHWYIKYKIQADAPKSGKEGDKRAELELRKMEVDVRRAELNLAKEEERVVTIDYMEQQLSACLEALRGKLMNFASKYAPECVGLSDPTAAREVLNGAIQEVMTSLVLVGDDPALDDADEGVSDD